MINRTQLAVAAFVVSLSLACSVCAGALRLEKKVEPIFIVAESGQQVDGVTAAKEDLAGKHILKCEPVELVAKSTGNISFKKKK